jgi:UDP-N-acetyl-D-glucosamine dehydrogenase
MSKETTTVAIVGLGYVGLPLSLQFARSGVKVLGLDIDSAKVAALNRGESYIKHITSEAIVEATSTGRFAASTDFRLVKEVESVIICVPTPLNKNREPDISFIIRTGEAIAPHLQKGTLIVLESTTYPGTTDEDLRGVLESGSGLKAGADFHLAFSPEREDPGNPDSKVASIPKVVGGYTPACLDRAKSLYSRAIKTIVPVSSCRVAEATKLLENTFRGVNIALVNELKIVYAAMGIDVWEVIDAAKTKPFGFMPFYPGPGLGGHCIPIDPFYLTWKAREYNFNTRFIELAGEINLQMPRYVRELVVRALNSKGKSLKGAEVLLLGVAYKKDVGDMRESPALHIVELLHEDQVRVKYHDPYVPGFEEGYLKLHSVALTEAAIAKADCVVIITDHSSFDFQFIVDHAQLVVDTRNVTASLKNRGDKVLVL